MAIIIMSASLVLSLRFSSAGEAQEQEHNLSESQSCLETRYFRGLAKTSEFEIINIFLLAKFSFVSFISSIMPFARPGVIKDWFLDKSFRFFG